MRVQGYRFGIFTKYRSNWSRDNAQQGKLSKEVIQLTGRDRQC
jgi:hypothetical protein